MKSAQARRVSATLVLAAAVLNGGGLCVPATAWAAPRPPIGTSARPLPSGPAIAPVDPEPDASAQVLANTDEMAAVYGVASLVDGETVLVGATDSADDNLDGNLIETDLEVAIATGSSAGAPIAVPMPSDSGDPQYIGGAAVTALTDGDFAVLYWGSTDSDGSLNPTDDPGTDDTLPDYYVQIFTDTGETVGSLLTVPDSAADANPEGTIAEDTATGGFVVTAETDDDQDLTVQAYSNAGVAGSTFTFTGNYTNAYDTSVDSLGNIVVLFQDWTSYAFEYLFIPSDATSATSSGVEAEVAAPTEGGDVTAIPGGGFAIFYCDGSDLDAQEVTTSGTLDSAIELGDLGTVATGNVVWQPVTLSGGGYAISLDPTADDSETIDDGYPGADQVVQVPASLGADSASVDTLTTSEGGDALVGPWIAADNTGGIATYTDISGNDSYSVEGYPLDATITALTYLGGGPALTAGATASFSGGGPAVALDPGLALSDPESDTIVSATVSIASGLIAGDTLNFATEDGIDGAYDSATGVLTLSGSASLADYQAALQSITYSFSPTNGDPTGGGTDPTRTIDWVVNDGTASSPTATSTLDAVHVQPEVVAGGTVTFTGGGSPVALDPTLTTSDTDSGGMLQSATVAVATGFVSGDTLTFTSGNGISGAYDAGTGTLTLTGSASIADYQAALESVTYSFSPSNGDPTGGGGGTSRTIDWTVGDGSTMNGTSNTGTSTLDVTHVAPVVNAGGSVDYTGGGSPVALDATLTAADVDSGGLLAGATVSITDTLASGDQLNFTNQNGITGSYDAETGTLTLAGSASIANYQAALDSVTYSFVGTDPTVGGADTSRTIAWTVADASTTNGTSAIATSALDVSPGTPTVSAGATASFGGGGSPVALDAGITVSDPSSGTLVGATVAIGAGFLSGDCLNFTNTALITGAYDTATGQLTLSGSASVSDYEAALASITYSFNPVDGDPTGGGTDLSRTIDWTASDSTTSSPTVTSTLDVTHVAPVVTAGGTASYTGGGSPVALEPTLSLQDVDSAGDLSGATVTVTPVVPGDQLSFTDQDGITGAYNSTSGTLTLSNSASIASYEAALQSITYSFAAGGDPTGGGADTERTIDWSVSDDSTTNGTSATALSTLDVTHAAPTVTAGATVTYAGGTSPVALDPALTVADPDSGGLLVGAAVSITSGFGSGDALGFTSQNGIAGSYDSATGVLTLSGDASIADYESALQSVTYSSSAVDPTDGGIQPTRTIAWSVSDGSTQNGTSDTATSSVDVRAGGPGITAGATVDFVDGGAPVAADAALALTDPSSATLTGATVSIAGGFLAGDALGFASQDGISATYDALTGVLTLTGSASAADYQAALETITYSFGAASADPTQAGTDPVRTLDWSATDGTRTSPTVTSAVDVSNPPAQLVFTTSALSGPASAAATLGPATVELEDRFGNPAAAPAGGVAVGLSSNSAGTAVFAAGASGSAVAHVTIAAGDSTASFFYGDEAAGTPVVAATAQGLTPATQQETITAAAASQLVFSTQPASAATPGLPWAAFQVSIEDAYGNVVTSGPGASDVVSLATTPSAGVSGASEAAVHGVATFPAFVVDQPGSYTLTASDATAGDTGLTPATSGPVVVRATAAPVSATAPGAPTGVVASASDQAALVSWTDPADTGGAAIASYTVTARDATHARDGGQTCIAAGADATSCTVRGLTNGHSYTFVVTATNAVGTGPASAPSNTVTPALPPPAATVPGAPTNVRAKAGNASASVSWAAPADNGGAPITAYIVTAVDASHARHGGQTCTARGPGATACTVRGLANGDRYTFVAVAVNAVGTGPASRPSGAITPAAPRPAAAYPEPASRVAVASRDLGAVAVSLRCSAAAACQGTLQILVGTRHGVGRHAVVSQVVIASTAVSLTGEGPTVEDLSVTPSGQALLGRLLVRKGLAVTLRIEVPGRAPALYAMTLSGP